MIYKIFLSKITHKDKHFSLIFKKMLAILYFFKQTHYLCIRHGKKSPYIL